MGYLEVEIHGIDKFPQISLQTILVKAKRDDDCPSAKEFLITLLLLLIRFHNSSPCFVSAHIWDFEQIVTLRIRMRAQTL